MISDGRRGIENQALGFAEALSRLRPLSLSRHRIENAGTFKAAPPRLQFALRGKPADYGLPKAMPAFAVGCGRQAIAPLLAIKAASPSTFTTYIQDPHIDPARFDLVIAPDHDALSGPNVETMLGAPNRITRERIITGTVAFTEKLETLPMPRIAMLIGGTSKTHTLQKSDHAVHINAARHALDKGYSVMITASRRTPDWVMADYRLLASDHNTVWLYDGTEDANPYFAFLGGADVILATEDSTNMLTEACATGKPVFTLPMSGKAGKFEQLYSALKTRCHVTPYAGGFTAPDYMPLNETARVAQQFWAHVDLKTAVVN